MRLIRLVIAILINKRLKKLEPEKWRKKIYLLNLNSYSSFIKFTIYDFFKLVFAPMTVIMFLIDFFVKKNLGVYEILLLRKGSTIDRFF